MAVFWTEDSIPDTSRSSRPPPSCTRLPKKSSPFFPTISFDPRLPRRREPVKHFLSPPRRFRLHWESRGATGVNEAEGAASDHRSCGSSDAMTRPTASHERSGGRPPEPEETNR